jgi:hypothetical protein
VITAWVGAGAPMFKLGTSPGVRYYLKRVTE